MYKANISFESASKTYDEVNLTSVQINLAELQDQVALSVYDVMTISIVNL